MVFSSAIFIFCFLPLTMAAYFLTYAVCRKKAIKPVNYVLLFASVVFYAWGGIKYLTILLIIICANYLLTRLMVRHERYRKLIFVLILAIDIGNLLYFKYFNFFVGNVQSLVSLSGLDVTLDVAKVILPIGISFYTFQIISYVADVYTGRVELQESIADLALYVIMFPQLIAGPIVRYTDVNNEIRSREITFGQAESGVRRFIIGFAKKVFLANMMGGVADTMFGYGGELNTAYSWLGVLCYGLQIYYDFSAYSDMAIGLGRVMGFNFGENFNKPYCSESIQEFWRRWHISLSSWFRDYVYIPLGGNRKGELRTCINLMIVFFLTGFWHGAAWQFIIWGLYHGVFCIIERLWLRRVLEKLPVFIRRLYMMIVVLIGWVFFRAEGLTEAWVYIRNLFSFDFSDFRYLMMMNQFTPLFVICFILALFFAFTKRNVFETIGKKAGTTAVRIGYLLLWLVSVLYLVGLSYNPFIYFQF